MAGDGRNLRLLSPVPVQDVVWVPVWTLPMRDDEQDRIQPETERTAS